MWLLAHCYMVARTLLCGFSVVLCGCLAIAWWLIKCIAMWLLGGYLLAQGAYLSSFPIKLLATEVKMQKIEPDPKKFITSESFGGSV